MTGTFANDSFFTLTLAERFGLMGLSLCLLIVTVLVSFTVGKRIGILGGLAAGLLLYWVFIWVSPQIYYTYYIAIFDDLPWQSVVGLPPSAVEVVELAFFQTQNNLSQISQGVGLWLVLLAGSLGGARHGA